MEYKVVTSSTASGLNDRVNSYLLEGWKIKGSHKVVIKWEQLQFSGSQHKATKIESEYSQTIYR